MHRSIDYYFSLVSPWAYIGHATFMNLTQRHSLDVCYVLDGEVFWGQDRIELLDDALTSGRKAYRNDI